MNISNHEFFPNYGTCFKCYGSCMLNCDSKLTISKLDFWQEFKDKIFEVKQKTLKSSKIEALNYTIDSE